MPWLQEAALTIESVDGWLDVFATLFETRWRLALRLLGVRDAMAVLDHAATIARQRRLERLVLLVNAWRVDLSCQCALTVQARQEAHAMRLEQVWAAAMASDQPGVGWRVAEACTLALTRLQAMVGGGQEAAATAEAAVQWLGRKGLVLPALRIELQAVLALRKVDGRAADGARVSALLERLQAQGMTGLALEAGPAMLGLLQGLPAARAGPWSVVARTLRGWLSHPPQLRSEFSPKELEVLGLLVQGESNKAIARALGVSENTVKFHLKHVFGKLGVDSRSAAIGAALQRGLGRSWIDAAVPRP